MASDVELPVAYPWPSPITIEQYQAFTPEKLELVSGYLIDGPESTEARRDLLALLLANCGLEEAVRLAEPLHWRNALDASYFDWNSQG
jgi:hypothetical protein